MTLSDTYKALTAKPGDLVPLSNDFSKANPLHENYLVTLKQENKVWQVDLTTDDNKPLLNTLAGFFPRRANSIMNTKLSNVTVSGDLMPPSLSNNQLVLKDGDQERIFDVNPKREGDLSVPLYGKLFAGGYYTSWDAKENTLYVIKDGRVITTPFKTTPVVMFEVTWPDLDAVKVDNYSTGDS